MAYTPYIEPSIIKGRLYGLVNFGDGGSNTFRPDAGGIIVTDDQLNQFQLEGEQVAISYLSTLYFVPLVSLDGGTTLAEFSDLTSGNLSRMFIASTCLVIVSYVYNNAGARKQMILEDYQRGFDQVKEFCLSKDESTGIIIPALYDLKLSHNYLTRQENPLPIFNPIVNNYIQNVFPPILNSMQTRSIAPRGYGNYNTKYVDIYTPYGLRKRN